MENVSSQNESPEISLLQHIHKGTVMGVESIRHVTTLSDDTAFIKSLNSQLKEYEEIESQSAALLRDAGQEPEGISAMAKFMTDMTSNMKSMMDHSPSKLAEIMIQGSTMGTTNLVKQMNDYRGEDHTVTQLAQDLLDTEKRNIEEMKKYL